MQSSRQTQWGLCPSPNDHLSLEFSKSYYLGLSTSKNKIIGWKSSSYWLSTVGNWMKISLRDFRGPTAIYSLCAHTHFSHHTSNDNDPSMVSEDPRNVSPWMDVRRRLENSSSRKRKFSGRLRGQRTCEKIIPSYRSLENRPILTSEDVLSYPLTESVPDLMRKWTCVEEEARKL